MDMQSRAYKIHTRALVRHMTISAFQYAHRAPLCGSWNCVDYAQRENEAINQAIAVNIYHFFSICLLFAYSMDQQNKSGWCFGECLCFSVLCFITYIYSCMAFVHHTSSGSKEEKNRWLKSHSCCLGHRHYCTSHSLSAMECIMYEWPHSLKSEFNNRSLSMANCSLKCDYDLNKYNFRLAANSGVQCVCAPVH